MTRKKLLLVGLILSAMLGFSQEKNPESRNPYIRTGQIGKAGRTIDNSEPAGVPASARSRAFKKWIGKKVLFMPQKQRIDGCPGFRVGFGPLTMSPPKDPCGGKIGTLVSVGTEEFPTVVVEVDGLSYQRIVEAGTDEDPQIAGLLLIEELDSAREKLIGKTLWAKDIGMLYTYDPDTDNFGDVVVRSGSQLEVIDLVSSWAVNTTNRFRLILRTQNGSEGFFDIEGPKYISRFFSTSNPSRAAPAPTPRSTALTDAQKATRASSVLELTSFSWGTGHGYATVEGMVKNISSAPIENVQAVAIFTDKNGNFITSAHALIEYRPILPGQSSLFKVMKSENPAMNSCRLEFKQLMGGELATYHNWKR